MIVYLAALLVVVLPALALGSTLHQRPTAGPASAVPDWRQAADRHVVIYYDPAVA